MVVSILNPNRRKSAGKFEVKWPPDFLPLRASGRWR